MSEMGMAMMGTGVALGDDRAAVATELAINSPLLEDIDMHGAKGILVNITAGMNLSLGEVQEIGDMVSEYTSDSSTVVVGTAIEMELEDEIRVTVVATGINDDEQPKVKIVPPKKVNSEINTNYAQQRRAINTASQQKVDNTSNEEITIKAEKDPIMTDDYLDIPAFLRNQAD